MRSDLGAFDLGSVALAGYAVLMHGLLLRLSSLDDDAASGLRVIGFFDALIAQATPIETLLRRTADLAECPVGIRIADTELTLRIAPTGQTCDGPIPDDAPTIQLTGGDKVWIERSGPPLPLDEMLLERFGLAATVSLAHHSRSVDQLSPAELLRVLLTSTDGFRQRRVLLQLGIDASTLITVVAVAGPRAGRADVVDQILGGRARTRTTELDKLQALLITGDLPEDLAVPVGSSVGVSDPLPAGDAATAWRQARTALRFAQPSRHPHPPYDDPEAVVVLYQRLGGFVLLAERLTPEEISAVPDVRLSTDCVRSLGGDLIQTIEAVAATESLRRAAALLHLHHNSVGHRVARAEHVLGFSISDPYAHSRLMLALVLQRDCGTRPGPEPPGLPTRTGEARARQMAHDRGAGRAR